MGERHGAELAAMVRSYLDDRIGLSGRECWSGADAGRDLILELTEASLDAHRGYAPDLFEENRAIAAAAGITTAETIVVSGFTDVVDMVRAHVGVGPDEHNCTAVLNPEQGFYAQTWDMHASAGEYVIMLDVRPDSHPRTVVQTTAGCIGQMGLNEDGIAVGVNNLISVGRIGVTWPFVVRKALQQSTVADAAEAVMSAPVAGGHNFMIMGPDGTGVNIEAMPHNSKTTPVTDKPFVHSNHCIDERTAREHGHRDPEHIADSELRLEIGAANAATPEAFFKDPAISRRALHHLDVVTCGAIIAHPATRVLEALWGVPGDGVWETFQL